ncbi:protoporphyrinogen oxidase [Rummeliibacillus pycnus]|uniref:protoporphyrinogen oxidase n=1 Tax=Rummeliibacillus pycnus TaxID=101070 RepID=UPI0037CC55F2
MIDVTEQKRRVAVIGGGITGLTAAFYLQQQAKDQKLPLEIVLIEATHRLGGKIQTLRKDNLIIERGPDSFLDQERVIEELAKQLGMEDQIISKVPGKTYVAINKQLSPIPDGSILGIPTEIIPFAKSDIISWSGKVRAACDLLLPPSNVKEDQSLGGFLRKRFGEEVVENLIEPVVSGVYSGDIDQLSLHETLPNLAEACLKHRSVIRGIQKENSQLKEGTLESTSRTFKHGLESLIFALEKSLEMAVIYKGVRVESISKVQDKIILLLNNQNSIPVDGVIVATPHHVATKLFRHEGLLKSLLDIPVKTVAAVSMIFSDSAIKKKFDGDGFVVSRNSDYSITACSLTHRKWPHAIPEDCAVLKSYVGRSGDESIVELSDNEIEKVVLQDLQGMLKIDEKPINTIVSRFKDSMPQYTIGHWKRVEQAKKELHAAYPTIRLAGNSYEGISLNDCIVQGEKAATEVLASIFQTELYL